MLSANSAKPEVSDHAGTRDPSAATPPRAAAPLRNCRRFTVSRFDGFAGLPRIPPNSGSISGHRPDIYPELVR